jgi:hypothetical protein
MTAISPFAIRNSFFIWNLVFAGKPFSVLDAINVYSTQRVDGELGILFYGILKLGSAHQAYPHPQKPENNIPSHSRYSLIVLDTIMSED